MSVFSECGLRGGNHNSDFLTEKGAGHIAIAFEPENTDALLVVAGHGKRGCIHNGEIVDEGTIIAQCGETLGVLVLTRIGGINAVHAVLAHQHLIAMDFQRTLNGHSVSGEIRHTGTSAENHDTALLQMTNGLERNVRLGDLTHGDGGLHARGLSLLLQEVLQSEAIHHRAQHAHIIAAGAVDSSLLKFRAAEEVAASDDDGDLNALLHRGNDFLSDTADDGRVNADFAAAKRLSG